MKGTHHSLLVILLLFLHLSAAGQTDRLAVVHQRTGDTTWLDLPGIVEVWADGQVYEGTVRALTDSSLVLALHEGISEEVPLGEVVLMRDEVTEILYWKAHGHDNTFDAAAYHQRRRRTDRLAGGVGALGAGLAFVVDPRLGAAVVLVAVGIHVVAHLRANAHFTSYKLGRKWRMP